MKLSLVLVSIILMQGCSSVAFHLAASSKPAPYAGTKMALKKTQKSWSEYYFYGQIMFVVADVPSSFIADTLLFPVDYVRLRNTMKESQKNM